MNAAVALDAMELPAAHDSVFRGHVPTYPKLGTVIERFGPLVLTHYGTHCIVDCPALGAADSVSAAVAELIAQAQESAGARGEPVEWRVFAHDAAASQVAAALDAAGFATGTERGVLMGEVDELHIPPLQADWTVKSVRRDEPEAERAPDLSTHSAGNCHRRR